MKIALLFKSAFTAAVKNYKGNGDLFVLIGLCHNNVLQNCSTYGYDLKTLLL